jgi:superfamily II DNA or RNA helicase
METKLSFSGYSLIKSKTNETTLEQIRKDLFVKPIENPNFEKINTGFRIYREGKTKIYVPRYYGFTQFGVPKTDVLYGGDPIDVTFHGTLREIQQTTVDSTLQVYAEHGGGLISLDTGLGKTVVALKLIELVKVKTLVVVHAQFLLDQWVERIKQYLPDARIGKIQQNKIEYLNCDICVGMIQSITKRDYPEECLKSFGHLIIDECFPYRQHIITEQGGMKIGSIYTLWKNKEELPLVLSFNEHTGKTEFKKITYAWKKYNERLLKINYKRCNINYKRSNLLCTENHKILTPTGYIPAIELKIGDFIKCSYGNVKITCIEKVKNKTKSVYDIEVQDNHNFMCGTSVTMGGPIVHNCHHICSKTFSSIFSKIQTKYMVGLSATPDRKDGLTKVIYWFLGPQIVKIKRETNKPTIKFVVNDASDYIEKFNKIGKINSPIMITDLTTKEPRNEIIIEIIQDCIKEGRKILVLSERRNHCEYFKARLDRLGLHSGLYLGGMKAVFRNETVNQDIILGTYQASGEGFDVPELDTLILATPKSDVEQAVGRILRQINQNEPTVFDIVDPFSIFKGQYYKRRKFYKSNEFKLISLL